MKIAIDRDYLRDALVDLVRINSINPGIAPTGPGRGRDRSLRRRRAAQARVGGGHPRA
jgi:hypothetical protein